MSEHDEPTPFAPMAALLRDRRRAPVRAILAGALSEEGVERWLGRSSARAAAGPR